MAVTSNDINMFLSGGSSNIDSDESLGGEPSSQPINSETLFSNVSQDDVDLGYTDYRCIYIFNEGIDNLTNAKLQIVAKEPAGAIVNLGVDYATDIQEMIIRGEVTGGSFTTLCPGTHVSGPLYQIKNVQYNANINIWASNFQAALRSCTTYGYSDITVTGTSTSTSYVFIISFVVDGDNRFYDLIDIQENNLIGDSPVITMRKKQNGSPMNAIAPLVPSMESAPSGVQFTTSIDEIVPIGRLSPDDGFPVWFKRVVTKGTTPVTDDGFTMRLTGD